MSEPLYPSVYREQIEVCVEILGRVLQVLDPTHLAQNCKAELQSGLHHPDDSVKVLALTQVSIRVHLAFIKQSVVCLSLSLTVCFSCVVDWSGRQPCRGHHRSSE